jgi:hypothetical protein
MKESEFIKLNFKFEVSNFCTNLEVKITSLRTAVRQLANTLTVRDSNCGLDSKVLTLTFVRAKCDEQIKSYNGNTIVIYDISNVIRHFTLRENCLNKRGKQTEFFLNSRVM